MRARTMLIATALALAATAAQAQTAAVPLRCSDFFRNPDGTWSPVQALTVATPQDGLFRVPLGIELHPGPVTPGSRLAARLGAECG